MKYLGEFLDIHCGGVDNIFPHHTNEIAQSEGYLGHPWCKYWFHIEHLNDNNGKMSKSSGEFLTLTLLESKGYNPLVYRLFCLQSHYRKQLVFSYEALDNTKIAYDKLINKVKNLKCAGEINQDKVNEYDHKFKMALADDLNTSMALTVLYEILKDKDINDASKLYLIDKFDMVLGLNLITDTDVSEELKLFIETEIKKRDIAKANKDYALADQIRDNLKDKGIIIKDTREGTIFEVLK